MGAACESNRNAPERALNKAPEPLKKAAKSAGAPDASAVKKAAEKATASAKDAAESGGKGVVEAAKKGDVKGAVKNAKTTAKEAVSAAKTNGKTETTNGKTETPSIPEVSSTLPSNLRAGAPAFQPAQSTQETQEKSTPKKESPSKDFTDKTPSKERARFIAEVKAKFRSIHTDGEPQMTKHEWMILLPEHGFSKEEASKAFAQIDKNNSGKISINEFDEFHISTNLRMILEEFRESHEDCHITSAEFRQRCYERYVCPISRVKRLFRILDTDGSGKITFQELEAGMKGDKAVKLLLEQLPNERSSTQTKDRNGKN